MRNMSNNVSINPPWLRSSGDLTRQAAIERCPDWGDLNMQAEKQAAIVQTAMETIHRTGVT